MPTTLFERGKLTDAFVTHMKATVPADLAVVGDGKAPTAAGWAGGQPNSGLFAASVVILTGGATPQRAPDTVRSRHDSWVAAYGLRTVGGARTQADAVADQARAAALLFLAVDPASIGLGLWKIQDVQFTALAPVERNDSTNPPTWELNDSLGIWVTRERGAT